MRPSPFVIRAAWVLLAAPIALNACSGDAGSGSPGTASSQTQGRSGLAAIPAVASRHGAIRRVRPSVSQPTCTPGPDSFVGNAMNPEGDNVAAASAFVGSGSANYACGDSSVIGGGDYNGTAIQAQGDEATVGGGGSNEALGGDATIGGGEGNVINGTGWGFIGGGLQNTMNGTNTGGNATIAGGYQNTENGNFDFIGGGTNNTITPQYGTISGGESNNVNTQWGTIGGGESNGITGQWGTIGGGETLTVGGAYGTAVGGQNNQVPGAWGAIGGGYGNQAAEIATVPGGKNNLATGEASFAAGTGSTAGYAGDFVWSDFASGATALKGTAANQFLARASGGVTFYSSKTLASGVKLAAGSGTCASLSDRNAKSGILPVSDDDILAKVSTLPISEWSYNTERGVRHVGPMAQDFYAAFNVGEDDRHITSIDEDGVALAAIKALNVRLNTKLHQKDAELRALRAELRSKDAALQQQLTALAAQVRALSANPR